ncbi:hypothetical protein CesoFtcFv8_006515 [Champsocephalus esox]|uniref:Microtubule associated tumor suppressor candidate 2 n=1 Tax=Champsocephalus esox TaxID=159716 RepID=A0AAN8HA05_9TELE|nr:hypothetical protein CesoFtcFv8_006515 [Champsocephalus esox]
MSGRGEPFREGELRNSNQQADGDANANEIRTEDGRMMAESGTMTETVQQDKVIIWGTDSQCEDPDLAEFEMLECQELEAYVVEDGKDFAGVAERKRRQDPNTSRSKGSADHVTDNKSRGEIKTILHEAGEQDTNASQKSESRELSKAELSSETDVYVSCLSTISSMDTAMDTTVRSQTTDSWHIASGPYSTISEDLTLTTDNVPERGKVSQRADQHPLPSGENTIHGIDVDMNLNSTVQSKDLVSEAQVSNGVCMCKDAFDEHRKNNNQINKVGNAIAEGEFDKRRSTEHKGIPTTKTAHEQSNIKMDKSTQADEAPDVNFTPSKTGTKGNQSSFESKAMKKQGSFDNSLKKQYPPEWSYKKQPSFETTLKKQPSFENTFNKQGSFENTVPSSSSSLERRKPWGSPSRPATPTSPKITFGSPKRRLLGSPAKVQSIRSLGFERSDSPQRGLGPTVRPPGKPGLSSCIPKPVSSQQKEPEPRRSSPPQKPKNVRPKIITYVRKNPQAKPQGTEVPIEGSTLPQRISSYSSPPAQKDVKVGTHPKSSPVLCSSNLLFDKYRQEMPKSGYHPPGMASAGVKPPGNNAPQRLSGKSGSFHEDISEKTLQENVSQDGCSVFRSPRALRPQLGLGAVTRQPAAKTRVQMGQRSAPVPGQSAQPAGASNQGNQDPAGDQKRSGLRPPGFSALPNSRLATLGFVRSSSASSVSSNQSNDSNQSDPCRPSEHHGSGSDDTPHQHAPQPPNAPSLQRRSLPPQGCSPLASRREMQKDMEAAPKSSPKRFSVVSPKPQSPVRGRTAAVHGAVRTERAQEMDQVLIQQLRERCKQQDLQVQSLQAQLKKASLCLDVFSITTQHFCIKSEGAVVKERELSLELARIRDEVAFSVAHWEQLQQEKEKLERRFKSELQGLRAQQQKELGVLEERLKAQHQAEAQSLQANQRAELQELRKKQREQIEEMSEDHEASLMEMETAHDDTLATLQEEHARTVKNLKMAHEQQTKSLEEDFHKIRLSLQDQVDTLTFQNRSLRDRAKRFEEALRKSTDEQILDALAPYKHIDEDLKSLKEVLEMKNQQIHQQEQKISELEKIAEKNVYLEERVQVLQQQNEDLKERIDKNLAMSRQLSEDNAHLQVNVEKESNEKKRLSRNNEELLWRLQTGELSPHMSPSASPLHRPLSGPGSPARPHSYHQ